MSRDEFGSLDDLLGVGEEEPEPRRWPGVPGRWWPVVALLVAVGLAGLTVLVARVAIRLALPLVPLIMVYFSVQVLRRALRAVAAVRPPEALRHPVPLPVPGQADEVERDGLRLAAARWERRLSWTAEGRRGQQFDQVLRPRLVELVDARLRLNHGVNRATDPDRARALLKDPLWTFLSGPGPRPPTPRELAVLIGQMEEI